MKTILTATKHHYIPSHISRALRKIQRAVYYIDKCILYTDSANLRLDIKKLAPHCEGIVQMPRVRPYGSKFELGWRVLQPTSNFFKEVTRQIHGTTAIALSSIELACDFLTKDRKDATTVFSFFVRSFCPARTRSPAVLYRPLGKGVASTTAYWGDRRNSPFVLYWDRATKTCKAGGRACAHLEARLTSSRAIKAAGIYSLNDLVDFKHKDFWRERLRLRAMPSKDTFARYLIENEPMTRQARHCRYQMYFENQNQKFTQVKLVGPAEARGRLKRTLIFRTRPVLHNLCLIEPDAKKVLIKIDPEGFLE